MAEIDHRFDCVQGTFNTESGEIIAIGNKKYGRVTLCFKARMHIPFAQIKLYSRDLAVDADAVFDAALKLGEEIARRWNECEEKR